MDCLYSAKKVGGSAIGIDAKAVTRLAMFPNQPRRKSQEPQQKVDEMTAKPETAAEVLADIDKLIAQNPLNDVSIGGFKTYLGHLIDFRDRIKRAIAAHPAADVSMRQRSDAWDAVCAALGSVDPGWSTHVGTGQQCAVAAIHRLGSALSAQGEAVGEVTDYYYGSPVVRWDRPKETNIGTKLYTHPAPARVTEEMVERVWMAATGRTRLGKGYENDARCMTAEERADTRAALEADHG